MTSVCVPSSPAARPASTGSRMRQLAGHSLACTIWRTASAPASHVGKTMPAVARNVGRRWIRIQASRDHAEDALTADHHPVGTRACARAGQPAALPPALRRQHAHRLDEVVDVRVVRRVVAAGAGGDPTAQRREAEALGEVAQREPLGAQLGLELGAVDPGLDARRPRDGVELEHAVEAVHGHRDDGVGARRVHAPHHRRPGAEGHHLRVVRRAPVEHRDELLVGAGVGHDVGRVGEVQVERVGAVGEVGAVGVEGPLPRLGGAEGREGIGHPSCEPGGARRRPGRAPAPA